MSYELICGDCLEIMPTLTDRGVTVVITDPPYGCGKADWDNLFPTKWYAQARSLGSMVVIITGSSGLRDSVPLVGNDFVDVISARNLNGMTRSPIGYGNWLAAVVAGAKPSQGVNFFEFVVTQEKPNHPTPKPLDYMKKLIQRVTAQGDTVLDPFMGSGTTGVACRLTRRRFIGIEKDLHYFAVAQKRIAETQPPAITDEGVFYQPEQAQLFEVAP